MSRETNGRFAVGGVSERRKQWVGERFGHLLVTDVEYGVQHGKKRRTMCTCKCDCGNEIRTVTEYLVAGKTSCGCDTNKKRIDANRIDLTGKRFGRLVVQEMLWIQPHTKCRCLCDCGNETIVINTGLTSGKTQSCGCYQRDRAVEANTEDFTNKVNAAGIRFIRRYKQSKPGAWIWECECPLCHNIFYGIPAMLNASKVTSCGCNSRCASKVESWIADFLNQMHVKFKKQYTFEDCRAIYRLRFDFALLSPTNEVLHLIEYDGAQHYKAVPFYGGEVGLECRRAHDKIKDTYCKENNIPLTRLPYTMSMSELKRAIKNIINP